MTRGYLVTSDEDEKEYWTYKLAGPTPWFVRAVKDSKDTMMIKEESLEHVSAPMEDEKSFDHDHTMQGTSVTMTR
jgi:hypothetical protein